MSQLLSRRGLEVAGVVDPVWTRVREDAEAIVQSEPSLATFIVSTILNQESLEGAVIHRIAGRLGHPAMPSDIIAQTYREFAEANRGIGEAFRADILAVADRDPACQRLIEPVLYFKGFHAIQAYRLANALWDAGRRDVALYIQSRASEVFQCDIHPAARIGRGIFLDHATGLVVGQTATIGDDVSMLHGVTLGGTGKERADRHPKIGNGVLIGAGAKILGNIKVGQCSRVAAGSVVLEEVPPKTTVAGVPARVVGTAGCAEPARTMDQILSAKADTSQHMF